MPNWCSNTLTIWGDEKQLSDFKSKALVKADHNNPNDMDFTFEGLWPTPPELLEQTAPSMYRGDEKDVEAQKEYLAKVKLLEETYGYTDWYNWRIANWGCKWDCSEAYIGQNNSDSMSVQFDTAWSPPIGWVKYVSKLYRDLNFKLSYSEPGMGFCGVYGIEDNLEFYDEGELEWMDDSGEAVYWDSEKQKYRYVESKEIIDDEDFFPVEFNPYG